MQSPPNLPTQRLRSRSTKPCFSASSLVSILLIVFTILFPQASEAVLGNALRWVSDHFGWYYMLVVAAYSLFALYVGCRAMATSSSGKITINPIFRFSPGRRCCFPPASALICCFSAHPELLAHYLTPPDGSGGSPKRRARRFRRHFCIGVYTAGAFMR